MKFIAEVVLAILIILGTPFYRIMDMANFMKLDNEKYMPIRPNDVAVYYIVSGIATLITIVFTIVVLIKFGFLLSVLAFAVAIMISPSLINLVSIIILNFLLKKNPV